MNDTPRTTTTAVTPEQSRILGDLIADHKLGQHYLTPRISCPSCVFGTGRKP